jgi:hypothetical protein
VPAQVALAPQPSPESVKARAEAAKKATKLAAKAKKNGSSIAPPFVIDKMYDFVRETYEAVERGDTFDAFPTKVLRPSRVSEKSVLCGELVEPSLFEVFNAELRIIDWKIVGDKPRCGGCGSDDIEFVGTTMDQTDTLGFAVRVAVERPHYDICAIRSCRKCASLPLPQGHPRPKCRWRDDHGAVLAQLRDDSLALYGMNVEHCVGPGPGDL